MMAPETASETAAAVAAAPDTESKHRLIAEHCAEVFAGKLGDYGPAWRMFRPISLVDQIYIKARRIRRLEELGGEGMVEDSAWEEYVGILNYATIGVWQIEQGEPELPERLAELEISKAWTDPEIATSRHLAVAEQALSLLQRKNHDYGEAWREMAIESITDELLSRAVRMKHLLQGPEPDPRRVLSQLYDTINYAAFALIRLAEG